MGETINSAWTRLRGVMAGLTGLRDAEHASAPRTTPTPGRRGARDSEPCGTRKAAAAAPTALVDTVTNDLHKRLWAEWIFRNSR